MKELLSFSTHEKDLALLEGGGLTALLREFALAGLELLPLTEVPEGVQELVLGVHLPFQPVWLPFWFEDRDYLREVFPGEENLVRFFGGDKPEDFVRRVATWLKRAFSLAPRYVVVHASHCGLEEVFSLSFRYETTTVLSAVAELLNAAFREAGLVLEASSPLILFENLWWPGLRFLHPSEVEFLFSRLDLPFSRLGLVLDTGHLLNLAYLLKRPCFPDRGPVSPAQALSLLWQAYGEVVASLGGLVRAVHLNFSPRADLFVPDEEGLVALRREPDPRRRFSLARQRVLAMDPHFPFYDVDLRAFLARLNPDFLVHELRFQGLEDLREKLAWQKGCL